MSNPLDDYEVVAFGNNIPVGHGDTLTASFKVPEAGLYLPVLMRLTRWKTDKKDPVRVALGRAWLAQENGAWRERREYLDEAMRLWMGEARHD